MHIALVMFFLVITSSSTASEILKIDRDRILQLALEHSYSSKNEYRPGDLDSSPDFMTVNCEFAHRPAVPCHAFVQLRIMPSAKSKVILSADRSCRRIDVYKQLDVLVWEDERVEIRGISSSSAETIVGCELLDSST